MFRAEDGDISLIYFRQISDATTENLREISSVSPNSAAAERVFSKLKSMFGDQQRGGLAPRRHHPNSKLRLMLRVNKRHIG